MASLKYPPTKNGLQKTLDAQLDAGVTSSMTLNNVTGIQNKPGVVVINRIDTSGNLKDAALREYISYTGTSGNTLTGLSRNIDSSTSDQDHAVGSVVEFVPDVTWAQAVIDALVNLVDASTLAVDTTKVVTPTGTQTLTNKTLTSPSMSSPTVSSGDVNLPSAGNIQVNSADPKRGIYIPASALFPATTSGCASLAQGETTTNKINYKYLAFDASTEEYAWIHLPTPDFWDLSTITVKFHWTFASGSGDVIWGAAGLCRSDDDALDTALGTAVTVTDTALTAGDEHTTSATSAITIGGTPAKGDKLYLRVYRDADVAGDTLGTDAYLTGITVKFGIGQYDDQ